MIDQHTQEEVEPYPYPFHVGQYDVRIMDRMRKAYPAWNQLIPERIPEFKEFERFLDTIFLDLWKPTSIRMEPMTKEAQVMDEILRVAHKMPAWNNLKAKADTNAALATVSTISIGKTIVFPEEQEGEEGSDGDGDGELSNEMRKSIAKAVQDASDDADNAENLQRLWGDQEGQDLTQDPAKLRTMLDILKNSERLQLVVKMLGRFRNQFRHARMVKSEYIPEEFVDIELGNDITKLLPSARILLADEELYILFLIKYLQRSLLQQVKHGNESLDSGPIVVLVDVSGSMEYSIGNFPGVGPISRVDWATALAVTMTTMAKEQKREYYIAVFDTRIRRELDSTTQHVGIQELSEFLAVRAGGGTNFEQPLARGLEVMTQSEYDKADMVFITDGECRVPEAFLTKFLASKDERQFKVTGIVCGTSGDSIKSFCDEVFEAGNINDADSTTHHIFSLGD